MEILNWNLKSFFNQQSTTPANVKPHWLRLLHRLKSHWPCTLWYWFSYNRSNPPKLCRIKMYDGWTNLWKTTKFVKFTWHLIKLNGAKNVIILDMIGYPKKEIMQSKQLCGVLILPFTIPAFVFNSVELCARWKND